MKRRALLFLAVSAISTTSWGYHITEVSVTPAAPDPADDVSVTVSGWKPASNYALAHTDLRRAGTFIMLDLYWQSAGCGAQVVTSYAETSNLGTLSAGTYSVCVKSWLNGRLCETASKSFTVAASGGHDDSGCDCYCHCWCFPCWPWWSCHRCGCGGGTSTSSSSSSTSTTGPGAATASSSDSSSNSSSFSQSTTP